MEPWLTPDAPDVSPRRADLLKGLDQVLYVLEEAVRDLPDEALWWEPASGVPPIGCRLQHLVGASHRLAAYALEADPDRDALAAEAAREWTITDRSKAELLDEVRHTVERVRERVRSLPDSALDEMCRVGRRQIPVRRAVVLHHLVEHAAHHAGQIALLVRLWRHAAQDPEAS